MDMHKLGREQRRKQPLVKGKRSRQPPQQSEGMAKRPFRRAETALKVVYISTPMKVTASASKFRAIVQELTGRESDVANIMESYGGNDTTWMVPDDHHDDGRKAAATTMSYAITTDERSVPLVLDNGSSPSVSSSEEFDGVFVRGQDSNFGLFDHSRLLFDQFFHQLDVLGSY